MNELGLPKSEVVQQRSMERVVALCLSFTGNSHERLQSTPGVIYNQYNPPEVSFQVHQLIRQDLFRNTVRCP